MTERGTIEFSLRDVKQETIPDQSIYCVKFCEKYPALWSYFATAGSNTISIYTIEGNEVNLVRHYIDEAIDTNFSPQVTDDNNSFTTVGRDNFYALTWASSDRNTPVVVVGGKKGIIKVVSTQSDCEVGFIHGHGGDIHELKTHPLKDELVVSASKDLSVRMWNVRSLVCVAIFGGEQGHRRDVLSLDIHPLGNCMVSSSLDTSIKIWNIISPKLLTSIERSDEPQPGNKAFRPHLEQIPLFSSLQIHSGYVDSVRWVGDCVLSKSTNNRIVLWMPDTNRHKGASLILQEYTIHHGNVWFIKMDISIPLGIFAVGNAKGKIFIFPLGPDIPESLLEDAQMEGDTTERYQFAKSCHALASITHQRVTSAVRQVSFSTHARYFVSCHDDGTVMTWEIHSRNASPKTMMSDAVSDKDQNCGNAP